MITMMMMQSVTFVYYFTAKQLFEHSNIPIASNSGWQVVFKDLVDYQDDDDYNCDDEADNDDSGGVAHDKHDAHSPIASTSQWVAGC